MKIVTGLTIILLFVILSVPVLAENTSTSSSIRTAKVEAEENIEAKLEKLNPNKKVIVLRIRNNVIVRFRVFEMLIERSGNLLTKLQERIDKAQTLGFNTKVVDGYMNDAKAKLDDARITLESIKLLKDTAIDKKTFQDLQKKFIIIHKDLNAVRLDGAKVISELKKFNAATPKPTKTATTSAILQP